MVAPSIQRYLALSLGILLWAATAVAQEEDAQTTAAEDGFTEAVAASGPAPEQAETSLSPEQIEDARRHYQRGVALFDETDFAGALVELQRAHAIAPSYRMLFDIAQTYYQLQDYARALQTFEAYLEEGGARIPEERRAHVEHELGVLRGRVAHVTITVNVEGAEVQVDGVSVGASPFSEPVLFSAGRRTVVVQKPGRVTEQRTIDVAGGDELSLEFELDAPRRSVTVNRTEIVEARRGRPVVVGLWVGTGVLTAGAVTLGVLARTSSDDWESERQDRPVTADDQRATQNRTKTLAFLADGLAVAAVVTGGVAVVGTARGPRDRAERKATVSVGPRGVSMRVQF